MQKKSYDDADRSVKSESHPAISRYAALRACAAALVEAARRGHVDAQWARAFARGVLKYDATHGTEVTPLDLLVAEAILPTRPERLYAFSMNLVDPPQAREPTEVEPNAAVCANFLRRLAGEFSGYFKR